MDCELQELDADEQDEELLDTVVELVLICSVDEQLELPGFTLELLLTLLSVVVLCELGSTTVLLLEQDEELCEDAVDQDELGELDVDCEDVDKLTVLELDCDEQELLLWLEQLDEDCEDVLKAAVDEVDSVWLDVDKPTVLELDEDEDTDVEVVSAKVLELGELDEDEDDADDVDMANVEELLADEQDDELEELLLSRGGGCGWMMIGCVPLRYRSLRTVNSPCQGTLCSPLLVGGGIRINSA